MKCPKCGYLGFETSDRCRNCGYDFSLSVAVESAPELPLQHGDADGVPLADFNLSTDGAAPSRSAPALDLDRLIGAHPEPGATMVAEPAAADSPPVSRRARPDRTRVEPAAPARSLDESAVATGSAPAPNEELPLFTKPGAEADDTPLITTPGPVRPPLSVRRATPDVPRGRSRTRITPRRDDPSLELESPPGQTAIKPVPTPVRAAAELRVAGALPRLAGTLIDGVLLGAIDAGVLYFTLAIASLSFDEVAKLPLIPLVAFLLILDGGYLIAFTTAGGQTIGKMLTGTRVMGDDGRRVDSAGAVLRTFGCFLSIATLGIGYLPVFLSAERRTLQDRIAGTRVVEDEA
jgi:uncharacterized RDD family membrane protein YckC